MKKIILFIALFISYSIFGQIDKYKCVFVNYKLSILNNDELENINDKKTKEVVKEIGKSINNLEYSLYCDGQSSIYYKLDKLDVKENTLTQRLATRLGGRGIYYKSNQEKIKFVQKETLGEIFNIQVEEDDWVITNEKKIIQGYVCYKATTTREEINYYTGTKSVFNPTVWFTPEIPIPFGPKGLDGLPGLVLEGTINGKTIIYASKIEFYSNDCNKDLNMPKGGVNVTKEEYGKLMAKRREDN